jgi:hypothetical protein
MRNINMLLAIALFITSCNTKQAGSILSPLIPDLATENLKGNISQVETDSYNIDSTGKTGPLDEKTIEKYDSSGYTISTVTMNGKDSIKSKTILKRNANSYVTDVQITGANNEKKSALIIEYDSLGKYSLAKSFDSTGKMDMYYSALTSNQFGEVTGGKAYHTDSTLKMSFISDYDSIYYAGNQSKDSLGKLTYSNKIKFNDKKDPAEMDETTITKDPKTKTDSTKNTITKYSYAGWDSHGNWTEQTSMNEKGKATKLIKRVITYIN